MTTIFVSQRHSNCIMCVQAALSNHMQTVNRLRVAPRPTSQRWDACFESQQYGMQCT